MVIKITKYVKIFITFLTIAIVVLIFFEIVHSWLSWMASDDLVNGRIKRIEKIIIFKGFDQMVFSDK